MTGRWINWGRVEWGQQVEPTGGLCASGRWVRLVWFGLVRRVSVSWVENNGLGWVWDWFGRCK